jgi:hypothetical protein
MSRRLRHGAKAWTAVSLFAEGLTMLRQLCLGTAAVLGLVALANGSYMLIAPMNWYFTVPGVPLSGPFNQHFLRDIGLIFVFISAAFLVGIARPEWRVALWGSASLWLAGHALFHVFEVTCGIREPSALVQDFPAVSVPALIGVALTLWAAIDRARPLSNLRSEIR